MTRSSQRRCYEWGVLCFYRNHAARAFLVDLFFVYTVFIRQSETRNEKSRTEIVSVSCVVFRNHAPGLVVVDLFLLETKKIVLHIGLFTLAG